jgi:hypothetical protein
MSALPVVHELLIHLTCLSALSVLSLLLPEWATLPPTSGLLLQLKWFCSDRSASASARVCYHASHQWVAVTT